MPPGLSNIPRFFGSIKVQPADLDPTFAFTSAQIATAIGQGTISPDQMGLTVWNATGSPITAGQLVYVSGWNAANSLPQVSLAVASAASPGFPYATAATHVALAAIANSASGKVGRHFQLTAQNTNAATVGDSVFLDVNAGGYTLTSAPAGSNYAQNVGRVTVKSATVGVIDFDLETGVPLTYIQSSRTQVPIPTVPVTAAATTSQILQMPAAGTIVSMFLVFVNGLAVNTGSGAGNGYVSFTVTNKAAGAGSTVLTAAPAAGTNSTLSGGGSTAVVAATPYALTGSAGPFTVAARDAIQLDITANTGGAATLANALNGGSFLVNWTPS